MPSERTEAGTAADDVPSAAPYAGLGLALAAAGCGVGWWLGVVGPSAGLGCLVAWAVQTATFWPLWARLKRGERALRVWVAGIAARVAGLGAAIAAAWATGVPVEPAAVAYGLTVMVLLWAEGVWLARAPRDEEEEAGGGAAGSRPAAGSIDS